MEDAVYGRGAQTDVVVTGHRLALTRRDMRTLKAGSWLNDEVVNMWVALLNDWKAKDAKAGADATAAASSSSSSTPGTAASSLPAPPAPSPPRLPVAYIPNSFFLERLTVKGAGYDYSTVKNWTKSAKADIFGACDAVIIPRNASNVHWTVIYVDMIGKTITHLDSLGQATRDCEAVLKWLGDEHKDKKAPGPPFQAEEWTILPPPGDLPQQLNGCDCGAFLCAFAFYCVQGRIPTTAADFSQDDIPAFRMAIAASIMAQRIMGV